MLTRSRSVVALPWMLALLCLVGSASFLPSQAAADAKDEEARMHFRVATAYYESGRFAEAAREFKLAHELSKRPQLLYNLFLASRDAGDIPTAAASLRQYLAEAPEVKDREVLEARLVALERIAATPAEQPIEEQEPEPEPVAAQEAEAPTEEQPAASTAPEEASGTRLNWLPWTLMGSGVALVAGGVTVGYLGVQDEKKLENDCPTPAQCTLSDSEVEQLKSDGKFKTTLGDALWIPGAVTAAVGLTLLIWKPWNKSDATPRVDVACSSKSCGALVTGRF